MLDKLILGAGPSGLSYSLFADKEIIVIEKNSYPGGHASSYEIEGFTFDYGPHILFSKDKQILDFIVHSLGDNVVQCKRNNKVSYKNKLIKYPFENDLKSLDPEDNFECISNFIFNEYKKLPFPTNMKEWFLYTFGEGIANKYLIPYNEKVWKIRAEDLSMLWADRIPNPPPIDVLKSSIGINTEGYLHQLYYHYPKYGGYQSISNYWAKACNVNFEEDVNRIDISNGSIKVQTNKEKYVTKKLISTINLSSLIGACSHWLPIAIVDAYKKLIINPMYVVSLGIKGLDLEKYTAIYFAESDFLVNRVSYPSTFSELNAPNGHYSIQCEITHKPGDEISFLSDEKLLDHVISGLKKRGLINGEIILRDIKRCKESYVVYNNGYEHYANLIRNYFSSLNIVLLGRFSYFEYINVDMAVDRSLKLAMRDQEIDNKNKLLESALEKIKKYN